MIIAGDVVFVTWEKGTCVQGGSSVLSLSLCCTGLAVTS